MVLIQIDLLLFISDKHIFIYKDTHLHSFTNRLSLTNCGNMTNVNNSVYFHE